LATVPSDFRMMLLAGCFNAAAFLALAKSLQLMPLAYVNALNATQATMAAVAGVLIFAERSSPALWCGVALTAVGLMLMQRKSPLKLHRTAGQSTGGRERGASDGNGPSPNGAEVSCAAPSFAGSAAESTSQRGAKRA
jgi:multidrug transporter EmrE-like cation transporter